MDVRRQRLRVLLLLAVLSCTVRSQQPSKGYCIANRCFALFQERSDFRQAQSVCRDRDAHLMTVRSSVENEVLLVLLGELTDRVWIGLSLATKCPDEDAKLKGFQWVTKDTESDFFNWGPSFDSSCSAPRCVSLSAEENFQWRQDACDGSLDGFLCEYSVTDPCGSLPAAAEETVSYLTPQGFGGEDLLALPPGSSAVRHPQELKFVCFSGIWLQAPWTCEIEEGGCEYRCVDPHNQPTCYCPQGQTVSRLNNVTCEADAQDPCVPLRCSYACYRHGDAYACTCDHGFKLAADGRSCVDINDCTDERQCPGEHFVCVNTVGGFQCVCQDGYRLQGRVCVDEDECASAPCEHECSNSPGSYGCSCYSGYKEDPGDPHKCVLHCGKEECPAECDPNDPNQCYCPTGYVAEERDTGTVCIDINECDFFYCDQNCVNTYGSHVCSCSAGYTLVDGYKCVKSEEDTEDSWEGSGTSTSSSGLTSALPRPQPTRRPSGVTVGALVAIIVCTAFFIVLVVCVAHHLLCSQSRTQGNKKDEAHGLHHVSSDA